jgi:hypothetical protein
MTEIKYVIEEGRQIPSDVTRVTDRQGDAWSLLGPDLWRCDKSDIGSNVDGDHLRFEWGPLTVTAVREPERKVERAGWPEEAAHWTDDADGDPVIAVREPDRAVEVERYQRLLKEQASNFLAATDKLVAERDESRAWADRLAHSVLTRFGIELDKGEEAEVWRIAHDVLWSDTEPVAAQPDPLVLSLPTVPPETVALAVLSDEGDEVRFVRSGLGWVRGPNDVRGIWPLGTILSEWGDARVVMREPRTWPKLDPPPALDPSLNDVRTVEVHGRGIWKRIPRGGDAWTQGQAVRTLHQLRELGDVTEVFEDEPGGGAA